MSLNLSNPTNSFHIQLYRNTSRYIIACVRKPYLLLAGNLIWDNNTGIVNCTNTCTFLSCLNHSWWHNFAGDIYILRARKEIWLPVNLTRPWGASPLETYIWTSLQRTLRALGLIIASVMSLVAIASTAAVAGLALHQSIQNAEFVQQWHEQSHRLWLQQRNIDSQLAERLDNMEQALTWLGDQLTVLSTRITLQCDWNSTQFCVTPVPFNISQNWTVIRKLLIGHKNISLDIQELTQNISEAFRQQLHVLSGTVTLQELGQRLAAFNTWTQIKTWISTISGSILLWALGLCLLLLVIRCSLRRHQKQKKTQEQIWATFLGLRQNKIKRGEMQGPLKTVC